jgi:hypothetical protein
MCFDHCKGHDEDAGQVERAARAIWEADNPAFAEIFDAETIGALWMNGSGSPEAARYRRLAAAALAAAGPAPSLAAVRPAEGRGYDFLNLTNPAWLTAVPLCLQCRALVWDQAHHDEWHADLRRALRGGDATTGEGP